MKKKLLAALLVTTMAIGILGGCGAKKETPTSSEVPVSSEVPASSEVPTSSEAPAEDKYVPSYPYETDVTLKIFLGGYPELSTTRTAHEDTPFWQGLIEKVGIDCELMYAPVGTPTATAYNLMLADEELPHIVLGAYTGSANMQALIEDGVALNINDYIEEYAPAYYAVLNTEDPYIERNKRMANVDGTIPAFNSYRSSLWMACYTGLAIRQDWLDELGLETPSTMAEMEEVLVAFKENYNAFLSVNLANMGYAFGSAMGAFHVGHQHYVEDGIIKASLEAPGLKDLVSLMHEWYEEGLLDPNFESADAGYYAQMSLEDKMGVCVTLGGYLTRWLDEAEAAGVTREWVGIPSMTNEAGDPVHLIQTTYSTFNGTVGAYITTACDTEEELKAAMAWCDWAYTEEGQMYWNFGTEGVSYEIVNGVPEFTDLLWNDERGLSQARRDYTGATAMPLGIQLEETVRASSAQQSIDAIDAWNSNQDAADYIVPSLQFDPDINQQNTDINVAVWTYAQEQLAKMIIGEVSIDKWDDFIAQCKEMGMDTHTANIQAAYDKFMAD